MISKDIFLDKVKEQVLPFIDIQKEKHILKISLIVAIFVYIITFVPSITAFITYPSKDILKDFLMIVLGPFVAAAAAQSAVFNWYIRRTKKQLRPLVLGILGAVSIPEEKLQGPTIPQLKKLHFLPSSASQKKDRIRNDSFGIMDEDIPFYIQEVFFSDGAKNNPRLFQGPLIRLFLPQKSDFVLMVIKKGTLFYKDYLALSAKKSLSAFLKAENQEPLILENPDFNKTYFAFTNDQIRARSILTPRFMERIHEVEKVYHAPTNFLFYKDQLILFAMTNKDMFEFFTGGRYLYPYKKFYDEINVLHRFKDLFKLN